MCGICGGTAFNDLGREYLKKIDAAVESLRLRGPDQKGTFLHGHIAIGQTRLSVIDTSEAASQPFTDASGRYTIVFNGEIYNYRDLKKDLVQKGISFRSGSDTEVLLYSYILDGPSMLQKLNGFFAFCVYDNLEDTIFLARDRMGIKPLYFFQDENSILFSSEIKALVAMGIPKEIDRTSLFSYLQLNYVPGPSSIFKNVSSAEPGNYYIIKGKHIETKAFYRIPYSSGNKTFDNYETACGRIQELMDISVQRRLISDVPLGAFLSGGVDSSIITAIASRHTTRLKTFSIGFKDEPLFDETQYAEEVAQRYKTDHSSFRLSTDDLYDILPKVLDYIDEPFADSSALAVYILSRETRKQVTVALSGDGADELYGGYIKHMAECRMRAPGVAENLVLWGNPFWQILPKSRNSKFSNKIRQLERFANGMKLNSGERYWRWAAIAGEEDTSSLFNNTTEKGTFLSRKKVYTDQIKEKGDFNDVLFADMHLVLRNDMLVKVDRMSMANSLEVRVPFLDHEHVNYVFSLPWFYKSGKNTRKKILKDAFRDLLPESVFHRSKHGFEVPLLKWFRGELRPMIHKDLLSPDFVREQAIFNSAAVENLLKQLDSNNPGDAAARIWGLVVFQYWWKKYLSK
jgi:asparagine synthase (glutamine-hydrolysing)